MSPPRAIIVEDNAEQTPFIFSKDVDRVRASLNTGDYGVLRPDVGEYLTRRKKPRKKDAPPPGFPSVSASGAGEHVATVEHADKTVTRYALLEFRVERKNIGDLVQCCTWERPRFEGEVLERMAAAFPNGRGVIVVEATLADVLQHRYRSKAEPAAVLASTIAWAHRLGIHTIWGGKPTECARWTEDWLVMALHEHVEAGARALRAAKDEADERAAILAAEG